MEGAGGLGPPPKSATVISVLLLYFSPFFIFLFFFQTYCGFFQCRVKSHLEDAENIFKLINFQDDNTSTLILMGQCDSELIVNVAFECVVASVECDLISEYYTEISEKGGTIMDAVAFIVGGREFELSRRKPSEHVDSYQLLDHYPLGSRELHQRGVSGGHALANIPVGLPFIDDDLSETAAEGTPAFQMGTQDEHMMASLQKLKTQPHRIQEGGAAGVEDWSFVRAGLVRKYGKAYYDGVRGDVINPNNSSSNRHVEILQRRVPEQRDDVSDEGIDVQECPPPCPLQSRRNQQLHPREKYPTSLDIVNKSLQTSGYRTGVYSTQNYQSSTVVCDEAPLSPNGLSTLNSTDPTRSSNARVGTQPVPRTIQQPSRTVQQPSRTVQQPAVHGVLRVGDNAEYSNSNNLSNIGRLSRATARSEAFPTEISSVRGSDVGDANLRVLNERWKCKSCTLENVSDSKVCDMCGKSRFAPVDTDGPRIGESVRICEKCTVENKPGSLVCVVCNAVLIPNNINTYV